MTWYTTELPLFSTTYYRYSINLEGRQRNLTFYWNEREGAWHFDLRNSDNSAVILGQKLVPQHPIAADYNLESGSLTGYFMLLPDNIAKKVDTLDYKVVPQFFSFFYVHEEV